MVYSSEIERILKNRKINVGDTISISKDGKTYEGILLPRIELGDTHSVVLKLNNGYNIGIRYGKGVKIELLEKGKPVELKHNPIEVQHDPNKSTISILGCGGTIASRIEYRTGAVFPAFSPGDLLHSFPELKHIANIRGRKLFDLLSEDITTDHWKIIAEEVSKEIKTGVDGVVLMHGTDTMHYTSAALSFMLQNLPVPVVLVGSQRSSDRGSSDNMMNLVCSTLTAATSDIANVSVCMHGTTSDDFCYVHSGVKVRKMHTSRRDAFQSINASPFAKVWFEDKKIEYLRNDFLKREKGRKMTVDTKLNSNVALVYTHPGIKPEFIESLRRHYDGVVIAGTGLGHVPANAFKDKFAKSLLPSLKSLINSDIPVVMAPQTIYGRINLNVYTAGRLLEEIGVIGNLCDWLPEVAYAKLMWVLGKTKKMDNVREMMLTNVAGEISKRSEVD